MSDEKPTYRERREARAERLRGWADKRQTDAAAVFEAGEPYRSDWAFITQPGHIPQRARLIAREDRAHESIRKAESMSARADGIERQLASSIYDDDPDALDRLAEKLAKLEAKREAYKAHNKRTRKAGACQCGESCACRDKWSVTRCGCTEHPLPAYVLSNLGGRITQLRQRIARLERTDG